MIQIYDSLTRTKKELIPTEPGHIRMYVCGMTVYDYCHLGHARMLVGFDVIQRWLRQQGYRVTYCRNITDIDDKIIRRAVETNQSLSQVTEFFIEAMHQDESALGVQSPDLEPRATHYIPQMLDIIGKLESKELAYQASNGDVNYAVRGFVGYGKLSGKSLDDLRAGERVAVDDAKRDPFDFVLWKSAKEFEPADTRWDSPYGWGRPGWHIECSAMSLDLGLPLDIHGGGPDLRFPHHENEIAQTEGAFDTALANTWMHCGPLMVDSEKMSKSLGNFFTIRDVLKTYHPEVVRFFIIRSHYRSPQNFAPDNLTEARAALTRLYTTLNHVPADTLGVDWTEPSAIRFQQVMNDDFNTPEAMAVLFDLSAEANRTGSARVSGQLKGLANILGLLELPPTTFLQGETQGLDIDVDALIQARKEAKLARDFALADKIRADLLEQGVILEDKPDGTTNWRKA